MAESESGQDKTEDPTEKRKKDSREKGEIARSKELNTLAVMMAGAGALLVFGGMLAEDLMELMRLNFTLSREVIMDQGSMGAFLLKSGQMALVAIQPFMITLLLAALIGPISLGGWLFAAGSMAPKIQPDEPGGRPEADVFVQGCGRTAQGAGQVFGHLGGGVGGAVIRRR
jgi:flagellar biosynthetic protein FlhB